jgi:hypothetical protein
MLTLQFNRETDSLLTPKFSRENDSLQTPQIRQPKLIFFCDHNSTAKTDSLLTPQFSSETYSLGITYLVEITSPHGLLLIRNR